MPPQPRSVCLYESYLSDIGLQKKMIRWGGSPSKRAGLYCCDEDSDAEAASASASSCNARAAAKVRISGEKNIIRCLHQRTAISSSSAPFSRTSACSSLCPQTNYKGLTGRTCETHPRSTPLTSVAHMWYRRRLLRKVHGRSDSEEEEDDQNGGSSRSVKFGGPKVPALRASGSKILDM